MGETGDMYYKTSKIIEIILSKDSNILSWLKT